MSEITFAKQFLTALDSKPQKLSSDYVADPKQLPAQPAFILPRTSKPYPKPTDTSSPTTQQLSVTLSPLRKTADSPQPVKLNVASRASIYDLKTQLGVQTGYATDKLKILWERKPITDSKTLQEVVGRDVGDVDLAVMYTGAPNTVPQGGEPSSQPPSFPSAAEPPATEKMQVDETPVAQGQSGKEVLDTKQFWNDLQDFVLLRVRDEAVGKEAVDVFEKAWKSR